MLNRFTIPQSALRIPHWFWPPVAREDNVFGDRNPVCSCVGMGHYAS
jgi:glycine dehydrogenase